MAEIVLTDGGMGQELLRRSVNKEPKRWSAEFLKSEPDLVRRLHAEYIESGAKVIIINAYSASYTRMTLVGAESEVPDLQRAACQLALAARDDLGAAAQDVAVAGCLPPLNGSYRPDRVRAFDVNLAEYRKLVAHQAPYVDLFVCETMSSAEEARAAATAACEAGKPVWVAWTLKEEAPALRSGETIAEANVSLGDLPVQAVLANCTSPESVSGAMPLLRECGRPFGGYANGFTHIPDQYIPGKTFKQLAARRDLDPATYSEIAAGWATAGARIIGGCCEVGPGHIARLRDRLCEDGHSLASIASLT